MRSSLLLVLAIGLFFIAGSVYGTPTRVYNSGTNYETHELLDSMTTPVNSVRTVSLIGSAASLSQRDLLIVLGGGRVYSFDTKKWVYHYPSKGYRENLITSWLARRERVRASYPFLLRDELVSK